MFYPLARPLYIGKGYFDGDPISAPEQSQFANQEQMHPIHQYLNYKPGYNPRYEQIVHPYTHNAYCLVELRKQAIVDQF